MKDMTSFQQYLHRLRPTARNLLWWAVEGFKVSKPSWKNTKETWQGWTHFGDSTSSFKGLVKRVKWTSKLLTSSSAVGVASRKDFKMDKSNSVRAQAIKRFRSVFEMEPIGLMSYVRYRINNPKSDDENNFLLSRPRPDSAYEQQFLKGERVWDLWLTADEQSYLLEWFCSQHWAVKDTVSRFRPHPLRWVPLLPQRHLSELKVCYMRGKTCSGEYVREVAP